MMAAFADWTLDFSSGIPVYRQIENFLYADIGRGRLREGDRLPTIRELAERFQINPNTVARAYRELDLKGIIASRRGDGSFVSSTHRSVPKLTAQQRRAKLDEVLGRLIAEVAVFGVSEDEVIHHIMERLRDHG